MQNDKIYEKKGEYDPKRYLPDPQHPEFVCPVEDFEAPTQAMFELHMLTNHQLEDIVGYLVNIQRMLWRDELIIRKITGRPAYEIVQLEDGTREA